MAIETMISIKEESRHEAYDALFPYCASAGLISIGMGFDYIGVTRLGFLVFSLGTFAFGVAMTNDYFRTKCCGKAGFLWKKQEVTKDVHQPLMG
jgi:hypothetical protein